jgi:hypothetical protein
MANATMDLHGNTAPPEVASEAERRLERVRKMAGAVAAPLTFVLIAAFIRSLEHRGCMLAGVLGAVAVLWMTEALPLPVTAQLGPTI